MTPIRRAVAQAGQRAGVDGVQQRARFLAVEHRRLAFLHDVFRAAHRVGRVHLDDVAGHQPVEQHPQRRQVLLHRRRRELALQLLDECRDVERLHVGELVQAVSLAPRGEAARGIEIGFARVVVVDLRGEEFQHALAAFGVGANSRRGKQGGAGERMRVVAIDRTLKSAAG